MKNILYILFFMVVNYKATAQITYIPDQGFEQVLIDLEIDSDGIINGQVLTSDIEGITELDLNALNWWITDIYDLIGIQDFTSLERLVIIFTQITELDVSQNLQLKELDCSSNWLTSIDVSSNTLLEKLYCGNYGIDVGPFNMIEEIDLSNNPGIYLINAYDMPTLKKINLKNENNNSNMSITVNLFPWGMDEPDYDPNEIRNIVCIEVDNEDLAQNNQYPYSAWNMIHEGHVAVNFSDECNQSIAQQEEFTGNIWYLEKLILNGENHFLPQNEEVNDSILEIDNDNSVFYIDFCYGGMADGLSFPEENYFTISNFIVFPIDCQITENSYYQGLYFNFIWYNQEFPFHYAVTEESNNLKKLVITGNDNNQAVYYNASLSVNNNKKSDFVIYPNPVSDILYFDTTDTTIDKVILFDISGSKILEQNQVNNISVSHLQKGSYILKIFSDKRVQAEKIIIK